MSNCYNNMKVYIYDYTYKLYIMNTNEVLKVGYINNKICKISRLVIENLLNLRVFILIMPTKRSALFPEFDSLFSC